MSDYEMPGHWIDGRIETDGEWIEVLNPADQTVIGRVPVATHARLEAAVEAAVRGLEIWRKVSPQDRARVLVRAADLLRERADFIGRQITLEQGKPLDQARLEVGRAADILEWDAAEGRRLYGQVIPAPHGMTYTATHHPIGVVAAFTPWNYPIASPSRKVAGALAAGCSVILKPSEETPAGAFHLASALADAGLPAGVLNLVYGYPEPISDFLVRHPDIRMVTLTGSVPVGRKVAALAGEYMKPSIMELGGHAPVIICEDADPDRAAELAVLGKSMNAGQVCVAPTRFYVAESLFERFRDAMAEGARKLRMGPGLAADTQLGPLANARRISAIETLVADAVKQGARLNAPADVPRTNAGYFHPLTILSEVPESARIMQEEPFGPVAMINPVSSVEHAIVQANRLPFGLSAYAFTRSAGLVRLLSEEIQSGTLAINHFGASVPETPFGGVKDSGFGREGGAHGVAAFTTVKTVAHLAEV